MKKHLFSAFLLSIGLAASAALPTWDLATSKPAAVRGNPVFRNGMAELNEKSSFAVPDSAFPDPLNFTVRITIEALDKKSPLHSCGVLRKQGKNDDGFHYALTLYPENPYWFQQIRCAVNNIVMTSINDAVRKTGFVPGVKLELVVSARDGFVSFYLNDRLYKRCFMKLIPNREMMWVGLLLNEKSPSIPFRVHSLKVYGADYRYLSSAEKKNGVSSRGILAGKNWSMDVPAVKHPEWPKVLIYGDSISAGYSGVFIPSMQKKNVYVYHCWSFFKDDPNLNALNGMVSSQNFAVIAFNNGLHSLHWTPEKVSDEVILKRMRSFVRTLKKSAPGAKLFWITTTPHTAKKDSSGKVTAFGELNPVVLRINRLSAQVMKEEHVETVDFYGVLAGKLSLAAGDQYHWTWQAYCLIAQELEKKILSALGKN